MNGTDFLVVSKEYQASHQIAKARTSISRSYYALHHHILQKWKSLGWSRRFTENVSKSRVTLLRRIECASTYDSVTQQLKRLKTWRDKADYNLNQEVDKKILSGPMAKSLLQSSKEAIKEFNSCKHDMARSEIVQKTILNDTKP